MYPRLHAQNIKLQQLIKDNEKLENDITEVKATCEKIKSLLEVVLGMKDNQEDSIDYKINDDDVPVLAEMIPDYSTIAILLKTKHLKVLVYEMITNRCQESFESQSMTDRNKTKREHNRNKQCVENFIMFMKDFPIKPDSVLKLRQWKLDIKKAIDVGYDILKDFVVSNDLMKLTKSGDIPMSSMRSKNNVIFFDNYRKSTNDGEEEEV